MLRTVFDDLDLIIQADLAAIQLMQQIQQTPSTFHAENEMQSYFNQNDANVKTSRER